MKLRRLGWQGLVAELAVAGAGAAWRHYRVRGHASALAGAPQPPRLPAPAGSATVDPKVLAAALRAQGLAPPAIAQVMAAVGLPVPASVRRALRPRRA